MKIYLDNAATSFPKPENVEQEMISVLRSASGSLHRSHSQSMLNLERKIYDVRQMVAEFFNFTWMDHVVFTKNVTESINVVLNGFLKENDRVVITTLEHNAVVRPLEHLKKTRNIEYDIVELNPQGKLDFEQMEKFLSEKPQLMIATSASNVTGDVVDLKKIGMLCKQYEVPFLVDAAQGAGIMHLDYKAINATFLAFTGHKSMLGPQGIGGLLIHPEFAKRVTPLCFGGTGSLSEHLEQPSIMPDRFESGTHNVPAILGLGAGIRFINEKGLDAIRSHETHLMRHFIEQIRLIEGIKCIGMPNPEERLGVLSLDFEHFDNSEVAHELQEAYGITVRVGLHCAPIAHRAYGSYPKGTIRFSVSVFTTIEEIDQTIIAIKEIVANG